MPKKDVSEKPLSTRRGKADTTTAAKKGKIVAASKDSPQQKKTTGSSKSTSKTSAKSVSKVAAEKATKAAAGAKRTVKAVAKAVTEEIKKKTAAKTAAKPTSRARSGGAASTKATARRTATSAVPIRDESEITPQSPTDVREHFFQEHRAAPVASEPRELPNEYGDTKIVLLIRDPEWAYAYWEVNDATREELKLPRNSHSKRLVLRMYKVDGRNWPEEGAHYFFDIDVGPYASNWYVKLPEPDSKWGGELGMYDDEGNYIAICRSNVIHVPRNGMSEDVDSEWMLVEEQFHQIFDASGGYSLKEFRGSETLLRQLEKQIIPGLKGEGLSSGALFSGAEKRQVAPQKNFWLQVHTELILYGATEPDARVTVQGKAIKLRPDGSFAMRFFLPDGEQTLEVHATNRDGDLERKITPVVIKRTK